MDTDSIYIVIPAYEPDEKLIALLDELSEKTEYKLIVVNDGSKADKKPIFDAAKERALLLEHEVNKGKGAAMRTAFEYLRDNAAAPYGVITADADGQHKTEDIKACAAALKAHPDKLIMGCRKFKGDIPLRSRFGNLMTRAVFKFAAGVGVSDTQTGLRSFSNELTDFMIDLKGDRYEFEMNMLLEAARNGIGFYEVPIETVYINENESSHFDPIKDSFRIYKDILKFSFSSLISFLVDYVMYSVIFTLTKGTVTANVSARLISSCVNFFMNKKVVFKNKENLYKTAFRYFLLAGCILAVNTVLLKLMVVYVIHNDYVAKIIVECLLFFFSWSAQRSYVFRKKGLKTDEKA